MRAKCPFYRGIYINQMFCPFQVYHYQKKECRKGGLLKTPNKLKYLETNKMNILTKGEINEN